MTARLLKLADHLTLIARYILLIQQVDVLDAPVVENKVMDVVIVNLPGLVHDVVTGPIQIGFDEAQPLGLRKFDLV